MSRGPGSPGEVDPDHPFDVDAALNAGRYPIDEWALVETDPSTDDLGTTETLFAVGNGYLGLRGNAEAFLPTVRSFASAEENRAASEALEQLASDIFYRTIEPW